MLLPDESAAAAAVAADRMPHLAKACICLTFLGGFHRPTMADGTVPNADRHLSIIHAHCACSELAHANVVRFVEAFLLSEPSGITKLCVVTELAPEGSLWQMLQSCPDADSAMQVTLLPVAVASASVLACHASVCY